SQGRPEGGHYRSKYGSPGTGHYRGSSGPPEGGRDRGPVSAVRRLLPRPLRRAASAWLSRGVSTRMRRDLGAMAKRGVPIVAGPWLGEVGFELLYWIPFLRWCAEEMDVDSNRFLAMSRGGTASWYRPFAARYADAFTYVDAAEFRDQHDARVRDLGEQKQTRVTEFDRELIDNAMRAARA